ncbi:interferon-induced very large GTPase 1-like [Pundamilia nyererei]|uniref:Interferon-induced very large GTPase 1-like n=1 Tax=Pundamilia nyererei TaxID=303518 RepID=A0A9Y6JGS8_9CICH|nr:PREDICTED: interferon-induced very large GTPase 1-like [Pundamilia nyererei]
MKSVPVYKAETPLVSFFRLGSLSVSKSQLMNTLINNRHETFFHRNCPGSTKSRYLMDGVAEIACCDAVKTKKGKYIMGLKDRNHSDLAQQLKDKAKDEEELQQQFSSVWSSWVTELTADIKPVEDINLEKDQLTILQELGFEWTLINECKTSGRYKNISEVGDYSDYIIICGQMSMIRMIEAYHKHVSFGPFSHEEQQQIRSLIDKAEKDSLDAIKSKCVAKRGYETTYLYEVANHLTKEVQKFLSERKYTLKKMFTVDLLLFVFYRVECWAVASHRKFKVINDALIYLESKKTQYYTVFKSFCKGNLFAVVLGELICNKLKANTVTAVCKKTATDLAGVIFPAFSGNRLNLEKHMLKSLAEKEDFDDFITYFTYPRTQEALSTSTQIVKIQRGNTDMWMKEFSNALKDELTFDNICFENFSDIKHFDFLKEEIKKGFKSITEHHLSLEKLNESSLKAEEFLIDQLCNCSWVTCPFCAAACTNTMKAHSPYDHTTPFHQLSVISGEHWGHTSESGMHVCTELFSSNYSFYPYHYSGRSTPDKQYRSAGSQYCTWRIPSDGSQAYWKWFVCRFQHELERHYDFKFQGRQEIPHQWKTVSKYEAIKSLGEMY